jgi:hypothetical protein
MSWLVVGGSVLCLAPLAGAAIVAGLLAFHEIRSRASRLSLGTVGRRASAGLLAEFLSEEAGADPRQRRQVPVPARRKQPVLLYELLDERQPRAVRIRRPRPPVATRGPRPTRLVPLTA